MKNFRKTNLVQKTVFLLTSFLTNHVLYLSSILRFLSSQNMLYQFFLRTACLVLLLLGLIFFNDFSLIKFLAMVYVLPGLSSIIHPRILFTKLSDFAAMV